MADHTNPSSTNAANLDEIWAALLSDAEPLWLTLPVAPLPAELAPASALPPVTTPTYTDFADDFIDERPLAEIAADYASPTQPTAANVKTIRRRSGQATVIEVLGELRPRIETQGGITWFQLIRAVQMVSGNEYKVQRIAEELADAGAVIIERPRRQMAGRGAISETDIQWYEPLARAAFAHLPRRQSDWDDVALALGKLGRKVTPELRPRLYDYYIAHSLNRTAEAALFTQLDHLRAKYPHLDPRANPDVDTATRGRWRTLPQVAEIYDTISRNHFWSVARIALQAYNRQVSFDDLFQEGCTGLLRAIDSFDSAHGHRFVAYANSWVNQRIRRAKEDNAGMVVLPNHVMVAYIAGKKNRRLLETGQGRGALIQAADKAAGLKRGLWQRLHRLLHPQSFERCPAALLIPDAAESTDDANTRTDNRYQLNALLAGIGDERDRKILSLRYGLVGDRDYTLEEIAQQLGITRERVRQIANEALKKLHQQAVCDKIRDDTVSVVLPSSSSIIVTHKPTKKPFENWTYRAVTW